MPSNSSNSRAAAAAEATSSLSYCDITYIWCFRTSCDVSGYLVMSQDMSLIGHHVMCPDIRIVLQDSQHPDCATWLPIRIILHRVRTIRIVLQMSRSVLSKWSCVLDWAGAGRQLSPIPTFRGLESILDTSVNLKLWITLKSNFNFATSTHRAK